MRLADDELADVSRSMPTGRRGRSIRISPRQPSMDSPRHACSIMNTEPAAHA